ncbi:MAG: hypothetical protein LUG91_05395 [Ruminococcus sp.]|nr:hypothetical protein [Ruminococcus sp.]
MATKVILVCLFLKNQKRFMKNQEAKMGYWGTGLYQNDVSDEVKESYLRALKNGNDNLTATKNIMEQCSDYIADEEDSIYFWLTLADTQWNMGRLLPDVKEHAIFCIERCLNDAEDAYLLSEGTLTRLKEKTHAAAASGKTYSKRTKVCLSLENRRCFCISNWHGKISRASFISSLDCDSKDQGSSLVSTSHNSSDYCSLLSGCRVSSVK